MSNEYDSTSQPSPDDSNADPESLPLEETLENPDSIHGDNTESLSKSRTPFADSPALLTDAQDASVETPRQPHAEPNVTAVESDETPLEFDSDGIIVVAEKINDEALESTAVSIAPAEVAEEPSGPLVVMPLDRVRLLKSYYFICDSKNWYLAILGGFLCVLVSQAIPLVPFVVFGGYLLIVIESQLGAPGQPYPDFAFEKFTDYLTKAVWPFLVSLGFLAFLTILYFTCYFGGIFGMIAASSVQDADTLGISLSLILPAMALMWVAVIFGTIILSSAMMLRAGLTGSFKEAFRIRWLWDFCRKTWLEQLMAAAFFSIAYNLLTILGLFAFCIGAFAAQAVALMAHAQVVSQLYRIYLSRGGEPMPGHVLGR